MMARKLKISNRSKLEAGFSVIELMIASAILAIISSVIAAFLSSTLHTNELNVVRSDLRSNITLAMELITTDLYSAGSAGVDTGEGACDISEVNSNDPDDYHPAFELTSSTSRSHAFTVRYCDPYDRTAKKVSYQLAADGDFTSLERSWVDETDTNNDFITTIPGVIGLELELECKPADTTNCDPTDSDFNYTHILSFKVKMAAQSTSKTKYAKQTSFFFSLDNSQPITNITEGYLYEYSEQTTRPINLTRTILE